MSDKSKVTWAMKSAGAAILNKMTRADDGWEKAAEVYEAMDKAKPKTKEEPTTHIWDSHDGSMFLTEMSEKHLTSCLQMLARGITEAKFFKSPESCIKWVARFAAELQRRKDAAKDRVDTVTFVAYNPTVTSFSETTW